MDIAREPDSRPRRRLWLYGAGGAALLALLWLGLGRLQPGARSVDAEFLWIGTVERGELVRSVRGPGTLVPAESPDRLKAEIRIAESHVEDLQVGQRARVDTRNGVVAARVTLIGPVAGSGTVTVEARLEGELPRGARPQQSIDGTIEIERLPDVLHVGRPVGATERAVVEIFKLSDDGDEAELVQVELGVSSVSEIEVVSGLEAGDRVILSDMSQYGDESRLRLR